MKMSPRVVGLLFLLPAFSCKQPIEVDTSSAAFIPKEIAVEELKELLPTAEVVRCSLPKIILGAKEIKSWTVTDKELTFETEGREPFRLKFADITALKLNRLNMYYEVRAFTSLEPRTWKEHFRLNWKVESPARRTLELIESLRKKSAPE